MSCTRATIEISVYVHFEHPAVDCVNRAELWAYYARSSAFAFYEDLRLSNTGITSYATQTPFKLNIREGPLP